MSINIEKVNIAGNCDLKCDYAFNYEPSQCIVQNNGGSLTIKYDQSTTPPVRFNTQPYQPQTLTLSCSANPFQFNGKNVEGILSITHNSTISNKSLTVVIPIINSFNSSNDASQIINEIINQTASLAPSKMSKATLLIDNFNLQNIVPKAPYYSITTNQQTYIIYGKQHAISISSDNIKTLKTITPQCSTLFTDADLFANTKPDFFYNESGPSPFSITNNDIYIECNPTGSSVEEEVVMKTPPANFNDFFNSESTQFVLKILLLMLFLITMFFVSYYFIHNVLSGHWKETNTSSTETEE